MELAFLIPWLLKAGHTPPEAERWTSQIPSWVQAPTGHIDRFASVFAAQGRTATQTRKDAWVKLHADLVEHWNDHRHQKAP